MGDDPLAAYRRERSQRNNMEPETGSQKPETGNQETQDAIQAELQDQPLTEHQALGMAIDALNQVPNHRLNGEYNSTYNLIPELRETYEIGKATEKLTDAAPELLDAMKAYFMPDKSLPLQQRIDNERAAEAACVAAIAKAMPAAAPEQEVTRERDIEPER